MDRVKLEASHIRAIAEAISGPPGGLTHSDIDYFLRDKGLPSERDGLNKWQRLFNGFADAINKNQNPAIVVSAIEYTLSPSRFFGQSDNLEPLRQGVNEPLALLGLAVTDEGRVIQSKRVTTLSQAERRARELRSDLTARGVHPDVLKFCKAELLNDNYFHAVLEATKSIAHKMRERTGLLDDGAPLADFVFGGDKPILVINAFHSKSEKDEQKGFCNLLKGIFGMFRNPTAHEAKINWTISKQDAEDLLSLVSLAHRRIDEAVMPPRV